MQDRSMPMAQCVVIHFSNGLMRMNHDHFSMLNLNDGYHIPQLGLGAWQASPAQIVSAVREALPAGYRYINAKVICENEEGVGSSIRKSGAASSEIIEYFI